MEKSDILKVLAKYKAKVEELGYNVFSVSLRGSQNYNLDDEYSLVDAVCIVLPSILEIAKGEEIIKKIRLAEGELIINDILTFNKYSKKGDPRWIEAANSEYYIGDLSIFKHYRLNPKEIYNLALRKEKELRTPYPNRSHVVDKLGYDPKQVHHIFRLDKLLTQLANDANIKYYKYPDEHKDKMIHIKRNGLSVKDIDKRMFNMIENMKQKSSELSYLFSGNRKIETEFKVLEKIEDIIKRHIINISTTCAKERNEIIISYKVDGNKVPQSHLELFPIIENWIQEKEDISYIIEATVSLES